jgi:FkbM family methyltransferase
MLSIAIIDVIGLTYDGTTLQQRGLGGSESAVILMSRELAKLGFEVTVFNNCIDREANPGVYDGVTYRDHTELDQANDLTFDIVISSRTVIPFLPPQLYHQFAGLRPDRYKKIKESARFKIVWMHDTFCTGDHLLEELVVRGDIDELFTLSDFHTSYVANCNHGNRRNFEILKQKLFMTRNGIVKYRSEVDIAAKDPFLYVYNASVTKGMLPLVNKIWPRVKAAIPQAKLKVIGGYYRFRENAEPDEQEKTWRTMVDDPKYASLDIEFTGVIKQKEIANILTKASFMLFPGAFPETFGISTLESLAYNTPLITTRFGALEETALNPACYLIDYAIEPNVLFPNINTEQQENKFVDEVIKAHNNRYLHQQKQYYCNIIKDICTWDTVALQWKQHFYKRLGEYLSKEEYRRVSYINSRVAQVFGRRFSNLEETYIPRKVEQRIVVVSPMYNAEQYIAGCIKSVAAQDYDNWSMIIIDDASTDRSYQVALDSIPSGYTDNIVVVHNDTNQGAVYNQISAIRSYCKADDIVMLLDGDDTLVNDNQIFHMYNNLYNGTTEFTYGSCWSISDNIPLIAQPYPEHIKQSKKYREHRFNWNMPYTHLRTFKAGLLTEDDTPFKDAEGNWYKAGGDGSVFYTLIERADPSKVKVVQDIVYNYNDANPINDYKVNGEEQTRNANRIIGKEEKKDMPVKNILIAIPTNKYIEPETFKSIYDLEVPEGYKTHFQFFYGYQIDQIRNLIASWAERYDYLFSVDSDISFAPDTLKKLLAHDRDVVSGLYIQRKPGKHILEVYRNGHNIPYGDIKGLGLVEIESCGFGCVLVKSEVIRAIGYPQFYYKSALDHNNTVSEDTYFCIKAKEKGYRIWADTSVQCGHHGSNVFTVDNNITQTPNDRLTELGNQRLLPAKHINYLKALGNTKRPRVIYDIGACVLHWTNEAEQIWPHAKFIAFEAMQESEELFKRKGIDYAIAVLSDTDNKTVEFYQNTVHPGGNSYYKENPEVNPVADSYFNESHKRTVLTRSLDSIVKEKGFPFPDLIKMDVQGAELDVIKGATECLRHCKDLILELQKVEYNKGAPLKDEVIAYVKSLGFSHVVGPFCDNGPDGDYHFFKM